MGRVVAVGMVLGLIASCNRIFGLDEISDLDAPHTDAPDGGPIDDGPSPDGPIVPSLPSPALNAPADGATVYIGKPLFAGTCLVGASVVVYVDGDGSATSCDSTCTTDGLFTCTLHGSGLADGQHTAIARQSLGDESSPQSPDVVFTVDTTVPPPPTIASPAPGASHTNQIPLVIAGTCTNSVDIELRNASGNVAVLPAQSCLNNQFSSAVSPADGDYLIIAKYAGATATVEKSIVVDTAAPSSPTVTVPSATHLNAASFTVAGGCEPSATVTVKNSGGATLCAAICNSASGYACATTTQPEGELQLTVTQIDLAGNQSAATYRNVVVDTMAPPLPAISTPTEAQQVGTTTPTIAGTCESGAYVAVTLANTGEAFCAASCSGSQFTCTKPNSAPILVTGLSYAVVAKQTDQAGNASGLSGSRSFAVNTTDDDNDGIVDVNDNCPPLSNVTQTDSDNDGVGDPCDSEPDTPQSIVAYLPFRITNELSGWTQQNVAIEGGVVLKATASIGSLAKSFSAGVSELQIGYQFNSSSSPGLVKVQLESSDGTVFASCAKQNPHADFPDLTSATSANETTAIAVNANGEMRLALETNGVVCMATLGSELQRSPSLNSPFFPMYNAPTARIALSGVGRVTYLLLLKND